MSELIGFAIALILIAGLGAYVYSKAGKSDVDERAKQTIDLLNEVASSVSKAYVQRPNLGTATIPAATLISSGGLSLSDVESGEIINKFGQVVTVTGNGRTEFFVDFPGVPEQECNRLMQSVREGGRVISIAVGTSGTARTPPVDPTVAQGDCGAASQTLRFRLKR